LASALGSVHAVRPEGKGMFQISKPTIVAVIGAGRILKVEGHSGGSNYFGAKKFLVPPLFSCTHPVFDGIRGTTIKVKQFCHF